MKIWLWVLGGLWGVSLVFLGPIGNAIVEKYVVEPGYVDQLPGKLIGFLGAFSFVLQPWFWGLTGLCLGLALRPQLDRVIAPSAVEPEPEAPAYKIHIDMERFQVAQSLRRYLSTRYKERKTRYPGKPDVLPLETRQKFLAMLARFKSVGMVVPDIESLDDLSFAIRAHQYLMAVDKFIHPGTMDEAKQRSKAEAERVYGKADLDAALERVGLEQV